MSGEIEHDSLDLREEDEIPEWFCSRCEENPTPGRADTNNEMCDVCLSEVRDDGRGHDAEPDKRRARRR